MCIASGAARADACFKDYKAQEMFGSSEQVEALQKLAKEACEIVGLSFNISTPFSRSTLLVADLEKGEMVRLKLDPGGARPWEAWSGFTREQVLADSPSDGFDLGQFVASKSGERPQLSPRLVKFINDNKLSKFL